MITRRNPRELYDPSDYGYSQLTTVPAAANLVFVSGQLADNPDGDRVDGFEPQVKAAFENLGFALAAAGASPETVVKITLLVVDHSDEKLAVVSKYRRAFFGEARPASTLIPVPRLAGDWMEFEIDAIAVS